MEDGTELLWHITEEENCTVSGEYSADDVLTFMQQSGFVDSDGVTLHMVYPWGGEATQELTLTWESDDTPPLVHEIYLPLVARNQAFQQASPGPQRPIAGGLALADMGLSTAFILARHRTKHNRKQTQRWMSLWMRLSRTPWRLMLSIVILLSILVGAVGPVQTARAATDLASSLVVVTIVLA